MVYDKITGLVYAKTWDEFISNMFEFCSNLIKNQSLLIESHPINISKSTQTIQKALVCRILINNNLTIFFFSQRSYSVSNCFHHLGVCHHLFLAVLLSPYFENWPIWLDFRIFLNSWIQNDNWIICVYTPTHCCEMCLELTCYRRIVNWQAWVCAYC